MYFVRSLIIIPTSKMNIRFDKIFLFFYGFIIKFRVIYNSVQTSNNHRQY